MTGTCGSRCIKEPCPCLCSSLWRPSGPACRYTRTPNTQTHNTLPAYVFKSRCGSQSLLGNLDSAVRTFQNYYSVWRQFGGLPEFYSIPQGYTVDKREGYPLRPGQPTFNVNTVTPQESVNERIRFFSNTVPFKPVCVTYSRVDRERHVPVQGHRRPHLPAAGP